MPAAPGFKWRPPQASTRCTSKMWLCPQMKRSGCSSWPREDASGVLGRSPADVGHRNLQSTCFKALVLRPGAARKLVIDVSVDCPDLGDVRQGISHMEVPMSPACHTSSQPSTCRLMRSSMWPWVSDSTAMFMGIVPSDRANSAKNVHIRFMKTTVAVLGACSGPCRWTCTTGSRSNQEPTRKAQRTPKRP